MSRRTSSLVPRLGIVAAFLLLVLAYVPPAHAIGTRAGTVISNQARVDYRDVNNNPLQALSVVVTTTVSQVAAVDISPDNSSNADPGDVVYYAHDAVNNGNGDDTLDIVATSSNGWTVTIYRDVDGNSAYTPGTDTPLTDTDGDTVPDTGLLADNGNRLLIVAVTVPTNAANNTVDATTVTATSSFNTAVFDSATDTTTIEAPELAVSKTVAPAGNQPPGTLLTYTMTITNNGAASANQVVLTDPIPANTLYVAASITYNAVPQTDADDPPTDNSDYNVTNPGRITVNVGTMTPAQAVTVTFQVTIQ